MSVSVIEWDRERLILADGSIDGNRVAFRTVQVVERSAEHAVTNELLTSIRTALPSVSGKQRRKVVLVFPRQSFTIYWIELPKVPVDELPEMVKLQASMRLTAPIEQVCLDFVPLPLQSDRETQDVLLVTVPREHIDSAREIIETCDLEVSEIRVSAFCTATAAIRAGIITPDSAGPEVDVLVLLRRDFIEVTVVSGSSVVFSHSGASWSSPGDVERSVRSELARARMAATENLNELKVRKLVLIGNPDVTSAISDQIAERLDKAVIQRVDPAVAFVSTPIPEGVSPAAVVNVAGAIATVTDRTIDGVDLLNPRRAPEKKDLRRVWTLAGVLAALVLFAAAYFWRSSNLTAVRNELAGVNDQVREITGLLESSRDDQRRAESVRDWLARDVNWLDEIEKLRTLIGGADRILLKELQFGVETGTQAGSIRISGFAKVREDVEILGRRLTDAGYVVSPFDYQLTGREGYPVSMTIDVTIPVESVIQTAAND